MSNDVFSSLPTICCPDDAEFSSPDQAARFGLQELGRDFYELGWSVGTSSNYSVVLDREPLQLLVTASGKDKGTLTDEDFVIVGENGKAVEEANGKPSAETMLHVMLARRRGVGSVLHTHSVWATILSDEHAGGLAMEGYEMLKGLEGVRTHEHKEWIPVFENDQDIPALARRVESYLNTNTGVHGFLIRRHGLYTWGKDLAEARRHVEIFEFLFEVLGRRRT